MDIIQLVKQNSIDGTYAVVDREYTRVSFPTGYMVSEPGENHPVVNVEERAYLPFLAFAVAALVGYGVPEGAYLGIWTDPKGWVYLDWSRHYENVHNAINIGYAHQQLAIWDCAQGQAIDLDYD